MKSIKTALQVALAALLALCFIIIVACGDDDDDDGECDDDNDVDNTNDDADDDSDDDDNDGVSFENDPPVNPYLADSPWHMAHRNPYCQGSSPYPGPTGDDNLAISFEPGWPISIFLLYSEPDNENKRAVWGSSLSRIFKIDAGQSPLSTIDWYDKGLSQSNLMAGAYTILDHEGTFFAPQNDTILAFANQSNKKADSPIILANTLTIPDAIQGEAVIGLNLSYDGYLAFATDAGRVGVASRDFGQVEVFQLSQEDEELSNSIAVDEDGGIYVVTSKRMYRVQWTGQDLTQAPEAGAWAAAYESGPDTRPPGRLGVGSGTTPSLMGFGDQDKFVVIGDGRELMHLVLFWRDEIPEDWEAIAPGKDRRIAGEVPITYGDPSATHTSTEQSVLVRGYDAVAVSNYYGPHALPSYLAAAVSNFAEFAPYGVEKFRWDPQTRTLTSVWSNPDISCPNGVPTMSEASGLMYCIGQRDEIWTLEALDWATGDSDFHLVLGEQFHFNSYYAATEIGPDRNIITGTFLGTLDIRPR